MRQTTNNNITIKYPDAVGFAFLQRLQKNIFAKKNGYSCRFHKIIVYLQKNK